MAGSKRFAIFRTARIQYGEGRCGKMGCQWKLAELFVLERGTDFGLDLVPKGTVFVEERLGVFAPLSETGLPVGIERAGLLDDSAFRTDVDDFAGAGDAFVEKDIDLDLAERRRDLVLDDLHFGPGPGSLAIVSGSGFDLFFSADIEALGGVEFKGVSTGRGFRITEHDADLHANLVDEDDGAGRFRDDAGDFAKSLAHEACLEPHERVAHIAFDFGFRDECGYGVHDDKVDGTGANERVDDFERLLAMVGLGDDERIDVDADFFGIGRIERMFGVDEGAGSSGLLHFGDGMEGERGLTRRFRAVDFDDATLGIASAERLVEGDGAGRGSLDLDCLMVAEAHNGTGAELFFDHREGRSQRFFLIVHGLGC